METLVIAKLQKKLKRRITPARRSTLKQLYPTDLAISKEKYKDLQVLKCFCQPANHAFFDNLSTTATDITDDSEGSGSDTDD